MRNKLLDQLYSAFNRDPDPAVALRISHPQGAAWSVNRSRLVVTTEAGVPLADLSLRTGTLDQVASSLALAGITILYLRPGFGPRHASTLINGAGRESESDGNAISGHRSVLWGLVSAYAIELEDAADRADAALQQAYLHSAQGDWLDYWGGYFGVYRTDGLSDSDYLTRIIVETLRPRSNKFAIENTVEDYTGKKVEIEEPWREIFILDWSKLSSDHKFKDGSTVGRNLIRPVSREPIDWADVLPLIDRNRAAGVLMLTPASRNLSYLDLSGICRISSGAIRGVGSVAFYEDRTRLDFNAIEDRPVINHPALVRRTNGWFSHVEYGGLVDVHVSAYRSYRDYLSLLIYPSQSWIGYASWRPTESWSSLTVAVSSAHTRTS